MPEVNFSRKLLGAFWGGRNSEKCRVSLLVSSVVALAMSVSLAAPAFSVEPTTGASPSDSEFSLDPDMTAYAKERGEIEAILKNIETQWNAHNLDGVMANYADEYVNNDGLDKKAVTALTQEFWKTYPDARSNSKTKQIRVEGNFATIESRDTATGSTAKEMPGIGTKGDLNSVSEGQLYMRKYGTSWRIVGDRIDYEKVRVAFGLAKQLDALFVAPEQVKSGNQYSAKLEVKLPPELGAVGSITSQPLQYPQITPADAWRPIDSDTHTLERMMPANTSNHNELLMATVGITNASKNSLMGISFLTRRLNVVPKAENQSVIAKAKTDEDTETPAAKTKGDKGDGKDKDDAKDKGAKEKNDKIELKDDGDLKKKRDAEKKEKKEKNAAPESKDSEKGED